MGDWRFGYAKVSHWRLYEFTLLFIADDDDSRIVAQGGEVFGV